MSKEPLIKNKKFWVPIVCVSLLGASTAGVFYQGVNNNEDKTIVQTDSTKDTEEKIYPAELLEKEEGKKTTGSKKKSAKDTVSDVYRRYGLDNEIVTPIATSSLEKSEIEKVVEVIYQIDKEDKPSIVPDVPLLPEEPIEPLEPIEPPVVLPPIEPEKPVEPPIEPEKPTPIPVDYSELEHLVRFVKVIDFNLYTPQSSAYLMRQQSLAEGMLSAQSSSQSMVNTQVSRLQTGIEQLIEVADFSSLQALLNEIDQIDLSRYTEETVATLQGIYNEGQELLKDKNATQAQVKIMRTRLYIAKISLNEKDFVTPLREELQVLLGKATSINRDLYLENSLVPFGVAILKAEAVMALENATEEQLTTEISHLQAAFNNLVLRPDKSSLQQAIEQAQVMDLSLYTEDSVAHLQTVIVQSQGTMNDWFAPQQEVDSAISEIETAIAQLEIYRETLPIEDITPEVPEEVTPEISVPEVVQPEEQEQEAGLVETPEIVEEAGVIEEQIVEVIVPSEPQTSKISEEQIVNEDTMIVE